MTLDELFSTLARQGLLLNNLFQLDSGVWRCSVRSRKDGTSFHFADHANPVSAVFAAIEKASAPGVPTRAVASRLLPSTPRTIPRLEDLDL